MAINDPNPNPARTVTITEDDSPSHSFISSHRHRCCFHFPCFGSPPSSSSAPHRLTSPSTTSTWDTTSSNNTRWWAGPIRAIKKLREWSEIVAGPKWKTFIRRFNRHRRHPSSAGKFQYDPLSYALNFDEGPGQNGHFEDDTYGSGGPHQFPDFSSRFASLPLSAKSSMDLGKAGAPVVGS